MDQLDTLVLRHKPAIKYNGLTVVLSHPSRFDLKSKTLICGISTNWFEENLKPFNRYGCDIRTRNSISSASPLLDGTKVVLLCGQQSLNVVGEHNRALEVLRGSPFDRNGIIYIPTFHPQDAIDRQNYEQSLNPALRDDDSDDESESKTESDFDTKDRSKTSRKNFRFWFGQDVSKAVRICREGVRHNSCNYILRPSSEVIINWLNSQQGQRIFFDIETTLDTKQITCFSVATDASTVYAIPVISYNGVFAYDVAVLSKIFQSLARAFRHNTIVVHNSLFDLFILLWKYRIPPPPVGQIEDTMVMHHRLYAEVEKSLGHCVSLYTDQPYHKDSGFFNPRSQAQENQLLLYNAKDVETLALVHHGILQRAKGVPGSLESFRQANTSIRPYLTLSYRGLRLNTDALCKHLDNLERRRELIERRILPVLVGWPLNPRSPKQVATYLYDQLGIERPKDGELTGKKALFRIALKRDVPALKVILALRRYSHEAGGLRFKLWNPHKGQESNRVTCAYIVTGTDTYRLASRSLLSSKDLEGYGTNLQNWNKDRTRYLVVPPPGKRLVQVDQAGAEALIVAWLCKPGRFRQLFKHGIKPHVFVALHLFKHVWKSVFDPGTVERMCCAEPEDLIKIEGWKELERIIKDSDKNPPSTRYYYHAKQTCHSANYDIKAPTFILGVLEKSDGQVALSLKEGTRFLGVYRDLFSEIPARNRAVMERVRATRILFNRFGFPRTFTRPLQTDHDFKTCYAFDPQSTVGTITNIAATEIQSSLDTGDYNGFELLQNNHDSLLASADPGDENRVAKILQTHLNRRMLNDDGEEFFMKSEASVGDNWRDMKEIKI